MSVRTSQYIRLAQLSARRNVEADPMRIKERVLAAISAKLEDNKKLAVYKVKLVDHSTRDNRRNALRSKGCGCELCLTRHEYTRLRYERRIFQQSYESSFSKESFNRAMQLKGCEDINPRDFFNTEMSIYNATIKALKARIKELESSHKRYASLEDID